MAMMNNPVARSEETVKLPATYFKEDGSAPDNSDDEIHNLKAKWHFQRNVAKTEMGENDYAFFDANLVIEQMKAMKLSLKVFARDRYYLLVKDAAEKCNMSHCNQSITTNKDLCDALKNLQRNSENENKVYMVLYAWFRNSYRFEAETVDEWAKINKYSVQKTGRLGRQRVKDPVLDRHGFGQIVKDARSDTIKTITRAMMRDAKWKVVATNKSKQSEKNETYYERNGLTVKGKYYVVVSEDTPEPKRRGPKDKIPNGPFDTDMLLELVKQDGRSTMSKQRMLELLKISTVTNHGDMVMDITQDAITIQNSTVGVANRTTQVRPTRQEYNTLDLNETMFNTEIEDDNDDMLPPDNDDNESEEMFSTPVLVSPRATTGKTDEVEIQQEKKRKERECAHENYYCSESYSDLARKAYFTPGYMKKRDYPVHYCTGTKEGGQKCGVDFSNPDFKVTTGAPVHACFHALKKETECVHALCHTCFAAAQNKNVSHQGRASHRRHIMNTATSDTKTPGYEEL